MILNLKNWVLKRSRSCLLCQKTRVKEKGKLAGDKERAIKEKKGLKRGWEHSPFKAREAGKREQ